MLSDSLRSRLEELNRERLPGAIPAKPPAPGRKPGGASCTAPAGVQPSGDLLESAVVCENAGGEHLVIPIPVDRLWPGGESRVAARLDHLRTLPEDRLAAGMAPLVAAMPASAVMLDLETCGLAGSAVFLVGLLRVVEGRLTVELLFARSYAEERAVMHSLWNRLAGDGSDAANGDGSDRDGSDRDSSDRDSSDRDGDQPCSVIATFNGKSFDWPMVMDRSRRHLLHKTQPLREPPHLDMLHPARRRWKGRLPDCKLQTIERLVCRRTRVGDIPGSQIPAAYDAYVRTGRPGEMEAVLHHNALDLVTLLDIAMRLAA
ncbi:MAG: ribonuclease H-like domain-containing protein [Planctomycetota bacterium]